AQAEPKKSKRTGLKQVSTREPGTETFGRAEDSQHSTSSSDQTLDWFTVIDKVRPVFRIAPVCRGWQAEQVIDCGRHVLGGLRISLRVGPNSIRTTNHPSGVRRRWDN